MKIETGTIVRTIVLAVAIINQILTACGVSPLPFDEETTTEFVSSVITVVVAVWTWWKNSSFTEGAIVADKVMRKVKSGEISCKNVEVFLDGESNAR